MGRYSAGTCKYKERILLMRGSGAHAAARIGWNIPLIAVRVLVASVFGHHLVLSVVGD